MSLVQPDFSGLWSVSWLGGKYNKKQETNTLNDVLSFIAMLTWILPIVVGCLSPIIICLLCSYKFYTLSICITSVLLYPYIFSKWIKVWPSFLRFAVIRACNYFEGGCSMLCEAPPNEGISTIYSYHPHGILCYGMLYNGGLRMIATVNQPELQPRYCGDAFAKWYRNVSATWHDKCLIAAKLYEVPIFRHMWVEWTGVMRKADRNTTKHLMRNNQSYSVYTGGFYEVGLFETGKEFVYIKKKKGFIKYALQFGYNIVPVYTFGESQTHSNLLNVLSKKYACAKKILQWLCDHKLPSCIWYPLLAYAKGVGIHTIYGAPIVVPKTENPTKEDIDKYHNIYCIQIQSLFDRNKYRFGMDEVELIVY